MRLKLGMCGFTIAAEQYYRRFPVVEVQQTFYDPPAPATLERWRAEAPPAFEFTIKAWQVITHRATSPTYRRLRSPFPDPARREAGDFRLNATVLRAWNVTLMCARLLRATAILFQCPASFRAVPGNIAAMRTFFTSIERPAGVRLLWEPRGAWPGDVVQPLCAELSLLHAVDPFVGASLTPQLRYWRLHGNRSHRARYTDEELRQLRDWAGADSATETYMLFNNIPRVQDIARFRELGLDA